MPIKATIYRVFIACPNDLKKEKDKVKKEISDINQIFKNHNIKLFPTGYEDCYPDAGIPQEVINAQIGEYDIFLGMMWKHYGTPSGIEGHEKESGTEAEFHLAREAIKLNPSIALFFYFIEEPFWPKLKSDIDQLKKVFLFLNKINKGKLALVRPVERRKHLIKQVHLDLENFLNSIPSKKEDQTYDEPTREEDQRISFHSMKMLVDLSEREQLTNMEGFEVSKTTKRITAVVKNAAKETKSIRFRHATQGHSIILDNEPFNEPLKKYWKRSGVNDPSVYALSLEHLQKDERFKEIRDLKGRLDQSYYLDVPYTGPNQEIIYSIEYHNGYQPSRGDWTGIILIGDVDKGELSVWFPSNKKPRDFVTRKGDPKVKDSFQDVHGDQEYNPKSNIFKWKFSNGKRGEAYEIRWEW